MENYRTASHSRFDIKYHFVWVTKYRKSILSGAVGTRVRDLVREICRTHEIEILQGAVSGDHIHVLLSCPPTLSPSKIMQLIKGKTSRKLMMEFKHIQKQYGVERKRDRRDDRRVHPRPRRHGAERRKRQFSGYSFVSEGLQSVAHEILEPTGFQPVVVQSLKPLELGALTATNFTVR
jgi:REP element-mobilizing transposase RayT